MQVEEIGAQEWDPIIICSLYWGGTGLQSCCRSWEGERKGQSRQHRPQRFPAHNTGRFCRLCLALPDTEPSLDLADNECEGLGGEDITERVSGKLPLHLGVHSLDFKARRLRALICVSNVLNKYFSIAVLRHWVLNCATTGFAFCACTEISDLLQVRHLPCP